jgi:hypothetical protein
MKIKEWIELLKKQNQNAEVILWEYDHKGIRSLYSPLTTTASQPTEKAFLVKSETFLTKLELTDVLIEQDAFNEEK